MIADSSPAVKIKILLYGNTDEVGILISFRSIHSLLDSDKVNHLNDQLL